MWLWFWAIYMKLIWFESVMWSADSHFNAFLMQYFFCFTLTYHDILVAMMTYFQNIVFFFSTFPNIFISEKHAQTINTTPNTTVNHIFCQLVNLPVLKFSDPELLVTEVFLVGHYGV